MKTRKRVLSGMQPTGQLHLGHYLGVLKNYVLLQKEYDCFFMIANWHSMTVFYNNYKQAHSYIAPMVSDWIAAGIDPDKATIFLQSEIIQHAELNLLLSMYTPVSWLLRNPTYKEKQDNIEKEIDSFGFLGYPVLQAADILLYDGEIVPIGEDQLPHLELSREIARRYNFINNLNETDGLTIPQAKLSAHPKVLGTDGRKMSKSYGNTIGLSESKEVIEKKLKEMKTDSGRVRRNDPGNPDNCPLFSFYDYFYPELKSEIDSECRKAGIGCVDCKGKIINKVLIETEPFRFTLEKFRSNSDELNQIIEAGTEKARKIAIETINKLKSNIGLTGKLSIK